MKSVVEISQLHQKADGTFEIEFRLKEGGSERFRVPNEALLDFSARMSAASMAAMPKAPEFKRWSVSYEAGTGRVAVTLLAPPGSGGTQLTFLLTGELPKALSNDLMAAYEAANRPVTKS